MISSGRTTTLGLCDFKAGLDEFGRINYWASYPNGYQINKLIMLDNGDLVQNTVIGNTNNPNVDMTGWVKTNSASHIFDEGGKTQQEINNSLNGLAYAPDLPSNRRLRIIAGSVRNSGDGWKWISDSAHTPVGVTPTVTASGTMIRIDYGFTAKRVVSLVATADETFSSLGFIIGGSVEKSYTNLQPKAPLSFTVDTVSGAISAPSHVAKAISAVVTSGVCTVTHPNVVGAGDAPSLTKIGTASPIHTDVTASYSATTSILNGVGDLDGQITYNGTTWAYNGELKTTPTMSWVTDGSDAYLRVTHLQSDVYNASIQSLTILNTKIAGVSGTEFRVRFYNQTGTLLLVPSTDMQFLFSRKANLPKTALRGIFSVKRGFTAVLTSDLANANGNFWVYGVMEVDK